jgi:hypothetical protein
MIPHIGEKGYMEYNAQSVPICPYVRKPGNSTSKTLIRGGNDEMSYLQVKLPGSIYILAQILVFDLTQQVLRGFLHIPMGFVVA